MSVTVTSKFQIVIPKEIREQMGLKPGDKVAWVGSRKNKRLVRVPTIDELAGIMKGMDVSGYRDEEDRG